MRKITIGRKGESIAVAYLKKHGFFVRARNYYSQFGEIDVIAEKEGQLHFIEVKTRQNLDSIQLGELLTDDKKRKMEKTISKYLAEFPEDDFSYQIDLLVVALNAKKKLAKIYHYESV